LIKVRVRLVKKKKKKEEKKKKKKNVFDKVEIKLEVIF
jgi:hypothetical protein